MTIADLMVLVAGLLPYLTVTFAKASARARFDNADPRNLEKLSARELRVYNAHLNGFEVFPFFAAAVVIAELHGVLQLRVDAFALIFIATRLFYTVAYASGKASLRSMFFMLGLASVVTLFALALFA